MSLLKTTFVVWDYIAEDMKEYLGRQSSQVGLFEAFPVLGINVKFHEIFGVFAHNYHVATIIDAPLARNRALLWIPLITFRKAFKLMLEWIVMFHEPSGICAYHHHVAGLLSTFEAGEGSHDLFGGVRFVYQSKNVVPGT